MGKKLKQQTTQRVEKVERTNVERRKKKKEQKQKQKKSHPPTHLSANAAASRSTFALSVMLEPSTDSARWYASSASPVWPQCSYSAPSSLQTSAWKGLIWIARA
jgi:hypothetical protein